jgi:hypothetical protein
MVSIVIVKDKHTLEQNRTEQLIAPPFCHYGQYYYCQGQTYIRTEQNRTEQLIAPPFCYYGQYYYCQRQTYIRTEQNRTEQNN